METASGSARMNLIHQRQLDLNQEGSVVDLQSLDCGSVQFIHKKHAQWICT